MNILISHLCKCRLHNYRKGLICKRDLQNLLFQLFKTD